MPDAPKEAKKDRTTGPKDDSNPDNSWVTQDRENEEKKRKDAEKEGAGAYIADAEDSDGGK